jgi:hypothetical protein
VLFGSDGSDYDVDSLVADNSSFMENTSFVYAGGSSPHYMVDDLKSAGAESFFISEDYKGRMYYYGHDNYKVISSTVVLGAFKNGGHLNHKNFLLSEMINYFLDITYQPPISIAQLDQGLDVKNYPNPFSSYTTIQYNIDKTSHVAIDIIDINGRLMRRLVDTKQTPGSYSTTWNIHQDGNIAEPGMYILKYTINGTIGYKKLLLVK